MGFLDYLLLALVGAGFWKAVSHARKKSCCGSCEGCAKRCASGRHAKP